MATKQHADLFEAGLRRPDRGVRIALENAVWVSSVLLLAEARMTGQMEPKEPAQSPEEL